jgi:flagellar hook-associated protein 2
MNENTDTTQTLGGDQLIRMVQNRLTRLVQDPQYGVSGDINRLNQLGVEITREGVLKLDEEKFNQVLAKKPDHVRKFFAGDGFNTGLIPSIRREIATLTNSAFGTIANRKKALEDNIRRTDESIANKERGLQRREDQLRRQFSRLEETMGRLKQQGAAVGNLASAGPASGMNLSGGQIKS